MRRAGRMCAVKSDSYNCDVIMLRHVYDSLIVARKARNYMSTVALQKKYMHTYIEAENVEI